MKPNTLHPGLCAGGSSKTSGPGGPGLSRGVQGASRGGSRGGAGALGFRGGSRGFGRKNGFAASVQEPACCGPPPPRYQGVGLNLPSVQHANQGWRILHYKIMCCILLCYMIFCDVIPYYVVSY